MSQPPPNFGKRQPPQRPPPPPWPPQEEPAERRGHRYNPLIVFGIAAFAVAALYALLVVATQTDQIFFPGNEIKTGILAKILPGLDSGEGPAAADINQRINILVLGLDRRIDEPAEVPARADTVFVLTVDPFSKTAGVLSIPRDLLVEIPNGLGGYFQDRINVAYVYGETQIDFPGGGPGLAIATVERNFKIPIDYYVVLDFNAFIALIDEIGGIDIDVPEYVFDPAYYECQRSCPPRFIEFYPGPQHMDGRTALAYARLREGSDDLERIERQHLVMRAAAEKALGINLFLPTTAISLYRKYKEAVDTNISDLQIPGLAKLAKDIGTQRLRMVSLHDAVQGDVTPSGAAVLIADWEKVEQLKRQIFADGRLQAEGARIQVQNGSGERGLATAFADFLAQQGLPPYLVEVADASDGQFHALTKIYDLNGKGYTAEKLAQWLGLGKDRIVNSNNPEATPFLGMGVDIVIVLGADAGLPEG